MAVQKTGNLENRIIQLENKNSLFEQQFQNYKVEVAQNSKEDLDKMQSYVQTHDAWVVGLVGVIIGFVGIVVALLAFFWHRKVEKNLEKIEEIKSDIKEIEASVNEKIEGELSEKVFQRFQEKEEEYIFDRLSNYDVGEIQHHLWKLLTLKQLKESRVSILMHFIRTEGKWRSAFITVMLQHFPEEFYSNKEFRDMVLSAGNHGELFPIEIISGTKKIYGQMKKGDEDIGILQIWVDYLKSNNRIEYEKLKLKIQEIFSGIKDINY